MHKLATKLGRLAAMRKKARLGGAFIEGVNPLGIGSIDIGRRTPDDASRSMALASTLGGAAGGGILVPAGFFGLAGLASKGRAGLVGMGAKDMGSHFMRGAINPFKQLGNAYGAYRNLGRVARTGGGLSGKEFNRLQDVMLQNTSISDTIKATQGVAGRSGPTLKEISRDLQPKAQVLAEKHGPKIQGWATKHGPDTMESVGKMTPQQAVSAARRKAKSVLGRLAGGKAPAGVVSARQSMAARALPHLRSKLIGKGLLFGLPAILGAYAAYRQFKKGRKLRKEDQLRQMYMYGMHGRGRTRRTA
jgi:hypothetical protein